MASFTGQMLVGSADRFHGGIIPTHFLFLSENHRPAWVLVPENVDSKNNAEKITWIPTVEHMIEDALLMIAIHVVKDQGIRELAGTISQKLESDWVELYDDIDEQDREELYQKCRAIDFMHYECKVVVTILKGSSIQDAASVLESYRIEAEVCPSNYSKGGSWDL